MSGEPVSDPDNNRATRSLLDLFDGGVRRWSDTACRPGGALSNAINDLLTGQSLLQRMVDGKAWLDAKARAVFVDLYNESLASITRNVAVQRRADKRAEAVQL